MGRATLRAPPSPAAASPARTRYVAPCGFTVAPPTALTPGCGTLPWPARTGSPCRGSRHRLHAARPPGVRPRGRRCWRGDAVQRAEHLPGTASLVGASGLGKRFWVELDDAAQDGVVALSPGEECQGQPVAVNSPAASRSPISAMVAEAVSSWMRPSLCEPAALSAASNGVKDQRVAASRRRPQHAQPGPDQQRPAHGRHIHERPHFNTAVIL